MKRGSIFLLILILLPLFKTWAQVPDFVIPTSICLNQTLTLNNTSSSSQRFVWDFCHDGLTNVTGGQLIASTNASEIPEGIEIVNDNGNWYGFYFGRNSNTLYRLDFGTDLSNQSPSLVNLGNLGSLFDLPTQIKVVKDQSTWFGLAINIGDSHLIRLNFGSTLSTPPASIVTSDLGNSGATVPRGIDLIESPSGYVAVISSWVNNGNLVMTRFSNGLNTNPTDTRTIATTISRPHGIALIFTNNTWFGLVAGYNDGAIFHFNFGPDLFDNTFIPIITNIPLASQPRDLNLVKDGLAFFAFIQTSGGLTRCDFGTDMNLTTPLIVNLGNFSGGIVDPLGLSLVREDANWKAFSLQQTSGKIYRLDFQDVCSQGDIAFKTTTTPSPSSIFFNNSGNYQIDLIAYNASGGFAIKSQAISVSTLNAPTIRFTNDNNCLGQMNHLVAFDQSGSTLSNTSWDFGGGNLATGNATTFQFPASGDFTVKVSSTAATGCSNLYDGIISIFNPPSASFTLPTDNPSCTNQNLVFTNSSVVAAGANPTWQWTVNGANVSNTKDLTSTFPTTNSQTIKLTAFILGCSSQSTQLFNVQQQGPLVDFNLPAITCQNAAINFNNLTSGAVTSYSWTYGDGNSSTTTAGANTYSSIGSYNVTLQANNAAGCQNSVTKPVTIYSKPQVDFSIGLPPFSCAGTSSQFTDATPSPIDSNLTNWNWNFGDSNNGSSISKNPAYTYITPNSYNVSLTVSTNFGCSATAQKAVTISPSPIASFTNSAACVNQVTQFTDTSTGSIQSRQWKILGNVFTSPNPQFTFASSNTFSVQLTVTGTNGCVAQINNNITVPVAPTLDFTYQIPCANSITTFTEVTNNVDPVVSQGWVFGSLANGNGSPAQFSFPTPNTYLVKLNSTRQSGCVYAVSKNISIVSSPIADFTASVDAGSAPLNVSFTNNSFQATSYQWSFGDKSNSTSALQNPTFIFSELGDYIVQLKASNAFNCSNQFSRVISVVIPKIDLVLNDFYLTDDGSGASQPTVSIINKSNVNVSDPSVIITSSDGAQIKKKISGTLKPNQEVTQQLDFLIVPRSSNYICAEVIAVGDVDLFLNRKCLTLSGDEILFSPFPNPTKTQLNLDWISFDGSDVSFQVVNSYGSIFLQQSVSGILKGLNRLVVNTGNLASGVYFIRFKDSKKDKAFSFIVSGN